MANTSSLDSAAGIAAIGGVGGSVNIYMAHGGTNWGFGNGANGGG
jgi:beta-galactosidase